MLELLDDRWRRQCDALRASFESARPFRHVVIDDFLSAELCESLAAEFPAFEDGFCLDERGLPSLKSYQESVRSIGPSYLRLDDLIRSTDFLGLMSQLTGIELLLYDTDYLSAGTHESRSGQDLNPHVDFNHHPSQGWHRRLNLLLYLNEEWQEEWGGCIELHSDPRDPETDQIRTILPIMNRCVIFETHEHSWHGFERIELPEGCGQLSRRCFVLYLYTLERPPETESAPHATVYVERPLPERFARGQALKQGDDELVARAMRRRLQHASLLFDRERDYTERLIELSAKYVARTSRTAATAWQSKAVLDILHDQDELLRNFYARETRLSAAIQNVRQLLELETAARPFPLCGPAELVGKRVGYMPDGWILEELRFGFKPLRALRALIFRGRLPDALGNLAEASELMLEVEGQVSRFTTTGLEVEWVVPVFLEADREVYVTLSSSRTWSPSVDGHTDTRELALLLEAIECVEQDSP